MIREKEEIHLKDTIREYYERLKELLKNPVVIAIFGISIITVLFLSAIVISVTSNPRFCITCHEMKPEYNAWQKSSHSQITCYACHVKPGLRSLIEDKLYVGIPTIIYGVTNNYRTPINRGSKVSLEMSNESCLVCHDEVKRKITPRAGLKMNHKPHLDKGIKCTVCHNRVAHRGAENYEGQHKVKISPAVNAVFKGVLQPKKPDYPDYQKMRYCRRCHISPEKRDKELMKMYPQLENLDIPTACTTCHPKNFNFKPPSHYVAGYFPYQLPGGKRNSWHSKGAKIDKKYCLSCHDERKLCYKCHQIWPLPHPKDWAGGKNIHPIYGKKEPKVCFRCHIARNFCDQCHHGRFMSNPIPWWSKIRGQSKHPVAAKQHGVATCFNCHNPLYCARCHTEGEIPDKNNLRDVR